MRGWKTTKTIIPLAALFVILLMIMPRVPRFSSDYRKGAPWAHETLISQFNFPILKPEAEMMAERSGLGGNVIPCFKFSDDLYGRILNDADNVPLRSPMKSDYLSSMKRILEKGIVSDESLRSVLNTDREDALVYILRRKKLAKAPAGEVFTVADAKAAILSDMVSAGHYKADSVLRASGAYEAVFPNLVYDKRSTELLDSERDRTVSATIGYVNVGQVIVARGEVVTAETANVLESYKQEFKRNVYGKSAFVFWLGSVLLAAILVLLLYFAVYFASPDLLREPNRFYYLVFVFALSSVLSILLCRFAEGYLYMFPFTMPALFLQSFYRNRVVFPVFVFSLLPLLIFAGNGTAMFVMYLAAGTVAIYMFRFFNRGWKQFVTAAVTFGVLALSYFAFYCLDLVSGSVVKDLSFLLVGSMLSVAAYTLIFLFERMFGLVSQWRLEELCDHSNPLLRNLELKAPGTYQHSLQVMNMSSAVARAVGANELLVRAGAMYHDIGKMLNPICFVENESMAGREEGSRYHESRTPSQSAADIIRHVSDGERIAREYRLPPLITDFIRTHHGTTRVAYFLSRYKAAGGDSADDSAFRYPGPVPCTREQIILMLCDSIEAAARSLRTPSSEAFDNLVETIVKTKIEEGQFDGADISLKEITAVKQTVKNYLSQLYHERIEYPKE